MQLNSLMTFSHAPLRILALTLLCGLATAQTRPNYWGSFLGGNGNDQCRGVSVAANGDILVVGQTLSTNLKVSAKAFQTKKGVNEDAFVARLSQDGKRLLALTYLGGNLSDEADFVQEARDGSIWVGGSTLSTDFPTTANAYSKATRYGQLFVTQLDAKLTRVLYSTTIKSPSSFRGGSNRFWIDDKNSWVYFATLGTRPMPTTSKAIKTQAQGLDVYLAILDRSQPKTTTLKYATFIGGKGAEATVGGMSVDGKGIVTLSGTTPSTDMPTTKGALQTTRKGTVSGLFGATSHSWIPRRRPSPSSPTPVSMPGSGAGTRMHSAWPSIPTGT